MLPVIIEYSSTYMNEAETAESTHGHGCSGPSSAAISRRSTPEGKGQHRQTSREKVSQDRHVSLLSIGGMAGNVSRKELENLCHVKEIGPEREEEMQKVALALD